MIKDLLVCRALPVCALLQWLWSGMTQIADLQRPSRCRYHVLTAILSAADDNSEEGIKKRKEAARKWIDEWRASQK